MRLSIVCAGVTSLGLLLMAAACSEEVIYQPAAPGDGGTSSSSTSSSSSSSGSSGDPEDDGGTTSSSSSGGTITVTPQNVKAGTAIVLGVTTDDMIVYIGVDAAQNTSLEAVPVAGGAPTVIEQAFDLDTANAALSGGVVGYWTAIDGTTGVSTFNIWTKAGGKKAALSTTALAGLFAGSEDGTRVAFSTGVAGMLSNIAVASTATPGTITNLLAAGDRINLAAAQGAAGAPAACPPRMRFAKNNLVAAFCTGAVATETQARLYWVPETSTTAEVRLDTVGAGTAAGSVKTAFFFDKNATKIFAVTQVPNGMPATTPTVGRVITPPAGAAAASSVALEDVASTAGFLLDDGSAVVYRTAVGMRRASTGAAPAPKTLVAGAKALVAVTKDQTRMFFANAPTQNGLDIQTADTTTENQTAKALVAGSTAQPLGLTATNAFFVYLEANKLKSQPVAGGAEKDLTLPKVAGAAVSGAGNGLILLTDPKTQGQAPNQITLVSLQYIDADTGKFSNAFATDVPDDALLMAKDKVVYSKIGANGAGIYVAPLP
jgi:hypothetical protein